MSTVVNLHTYTARMDYSYSRHSNNAGAALPHIPRRTPSSSRTATLFPLHSAPSSPPATISRVLSADAAYPLVTPTPTVLVVEPSPPQEPTPEAASNSDSSGSESYVQMNPRAKRVRTPKLQPFRSAADSTPTPAVLNAKSTSLQTVAFPAQAAVEKDTAGDDTPRASSSLATPKPNVQTAPGVTMKPSGSQEPTTPPPVTRADSNRAVSAPHPGAAKFARKKSGEPLKSSLKSRRPAVRGDLSVVTGIVSTKSEPSTPTKSVHFDARLEHVKLFLAEQKPLAISREGSPTDTSGTESDFPSLIFGPKSASEEEKMLTMTVTNMPATPRADADVALDELTLSVDGLSLNGRVRVRNIAFEKWVAVRFTVDYWQTTSEVTAKYLDSIPGGVFDRFTFTIRLSDMLMRIEEKTMFLALRYNVSGREIWDNNGNMNYKVVFAKVPRPQPASPASPSTPDTANLASLKSKLENVARGHGTVGGFMAQRRSNSFTLEASTSLRARYDFSTSLRTSWTTRSPPMSATPTKSSHVRNVTYPNMQKRGALSKLAMYEDVRQSAARSPRILDPDSPMERPSSFYANASGASANANSAEMDAELEESPGPIMSRRRNRNHQRAYFDTTDSSPLSSPSVKRTPIGSPVSKLSAAALELIAKEGEEGERPVWFGLERGGSVESTPSVTSNEESSLPSSPSGSPTDDRVFGFGGTRRPESESYSSFLNKYCYYTGNDDAFSDQQDVIQRSHSASSVEEFLSMSPSQSYLLPPEGIPTRSSSYDDVMSISSGSVTPTMRTAGFASLVDSPSMMSAAR